MLRTPTRRCQCQVIRHGMWQSRAGRIEAGPASVPFACKLEQAGKTHAVPDSADKRIWHAPATIAAPAAAPARCSDWGLPGLTPNLTFTSGLPSGLSTFKFKDKWARIRFDLLLIYNLENLLNLPSIEKNKIVDGPRATMAICGRNFISNSVPHHCQGNQQQQHPVGSQQAAPCTVHSE